MFALRIHDILHAQHSAWVIYFSICGLYTYEWNRAKVWINPILVVGNNVDSFFPFTMTKEQEWRLQYVSYLVRTSYAFRKLYVSKSPTFNIFVILIQCEVFCVIHSFFSNKEPTLFDFQLIHFAKTIPNQNHQFIKCQRPYNSETNAHFELLSVNMLLKNNETIFVKGNVT